MSKNVFNISILRITLKFLNDIINMSIQEYTNFLRKIRGEREHESTGLYL